MIDAADRPQSTITPAEFETFVAQQLLVAAGEAVEDLAVTVHEKVMGLDGAYDFDATVRYRFAGLAFLVLVEAKLHRHPIKRELVQVLHQKIQSVGAHKGVMVAVSPYQSGALEFASAHGIALVTVAEGRFVFATRDDGAGGCAKLVARLHSGSGRRGFVLSPDDEDYPDCVATFVLGRPAA